MMTFVHGFFFFLNLYSMTFSLSHESIKKVKKHCVMASGPSGYKTSADIAYR